MTAIAHEPTIDRPPARTLELVLARAHLRLGSLALARVELETIAGLGTIDTDGLVDLAEVRWRTGDLLGAGEAANAVLRTDQTYLVVLVIAAEASSALGRPTEARRLAQLAMGRAGGTIDQVFAGMPRSGVWPGDGDEPPPTAPTLFDGGPEPQAQGDEREADPADHALPAAKAPTGPVALGFWDGDETIDPGPTIMPDPARELEAGRTALVAGEFEEAALRLGVALRLAPALAPAVLEATQGARGPSITLVRGDAYRLAGHEPEAREAYATAAGGGLPERRRRARPKPKPASEPLDDGVDGDQPAATEAAGEEPDGVADHDAATEPDAAAGPEAAAMADVDIGPDHETPA